MRPQRLRVRLRLPARAAGHLRNLLGSAVAVLLTFGCGRGGGGSSGSGNDFTGLAADVTAVDLGGERVEVRFLLQASATEDLGVELNYSENRGISYSAATVDSLPQDPGALPADPNGVRHSIIWNVSADIEDLRQHDLRVQVVPYDLKSGERGIAGVSPVFGLGDNAAPTIVSVIAPDGVRGGWIPFEYTVSDPDGDHVGIQGEFSLDKGSTYFPATLGGGDGVEMVAAPAAGAVRSIAWNAHGDAPERLDAHVRLRLRAVDTEAGAFAASGDFAIDTRAPAIDLLTINEIPAAMNGSMEFTDTANQLQAFTLLAPERGFAIWIEFSPGGAAVDPATLSATSISPLGGGSPAGGTDAGQDFGGRFSVDASGGVARLIIGADLSFPHGLQTITVRISDVLGNPSAPVSYTFETGPATSANRPFENPDRWHLVFSRDNFAISSSANAQGIVSIAVKAGPNGSADFVEDLRILGLQSADPPPAAAGLNALVLKAVQMAIVGRLNELYGRNFDGTAGADSANLEFSLVPPAAPSSRIGIGGDDPLPGYTIGRAEYDSRNSSTNDDSPSDLGIFTTNLIEFYINSSYSFRSRFNPLIPGRGTPIGLHSLDPAVLAPSFDRDDPGNTLRENQRYDQIASAIDAISRCTAAILAHEIGHSVGLVANSAPPEGLFGGEYMASFAGPYTNSYHLDAVDNDIMASALSFSESILPAPNGPRFNSLSFAYLLERILLE